MARSRNKVYKQGDRINIYLSRDLTPDFVEWINKQSDLSNFFLYAAQQLYQQTGFVDVSEVMPRKINFDLSSVTKSIPHIERETKQLVKEDTDTIVEHETEEIFELEEKEENNSAWSNIQNLDDPYA